MKVPKYNILYKVNHCIDYIKKDCELIAIIPPNKALTDDEVRSYFNIDEGHKHWHRAHRPVRFTRYVFDKAIIPITENYMIEPVI